MPEIWEEKVAMVSHSKTHMMVEAPSIKKIVRNRKRFQSERTPTEAVLVLDAGGAIQDLTPDARRLLGYHPEQPYKPSFFSHVHAKDLYRVMRDVAEMAFHGRTEADWRIRLRMGTGRWHWYSVVVDNQLDHPEQAILMSLKAPVA